MIVVLAVVAGALALTLPAILAPFNKSELQDAAKQVRTGLSQARSAAIASGVPHEFRYQPGGRRWEVVPRQGQADNQAPAGAGRAAAPAYDPAAEPWADALAAMQTIEEELPNGVVFASPTGEEPALAECPAADAPEPPPVASEQWSLPIVFYPNGRASNECIRLVGQREFCVNVHLRGLTGSATIGDAERPEDYESQTELMTATDGLVP